MYTRDRNNNKQDKKVFLIHTHNKKRVIVIVYNKQLTYSSMVIAH